MGLFGFSLYSLLKIRKTLMAGHSKFKNIMHRKGAQDAKRAKVFAKLAREVTVAARVGGDDPAMNARLRSAISAARSQNMPNENIQRAIAKASGAGGGAEYEEIRYEGYGPAGVAVIIETLTDNRNRTASEIRAAFAKHGGALGETNSVSFLFDKVGVVIYSNEAGSIEEIFDMALEFGASDHNFVDGAHYITCKSEEFTALRDGLEKKLGIAVSSVLEWQAQTLASLSEEAMIKLSNFLEVLEDNDDIQRIAVNVEIEISSVEGVKA